MIKLHFLTIITLATGFIFNAIHGMQGVAQHESVVSQSLHEPGSAALPNPNRDAETPNTLLVVWELVSGLQAIEQDPALQGELTQIQGALARLQTSLREPTGSPTQLIRSAAGL